MVTEEIFIGRKRYKNDKKTVESLQLTSGLMFATPDADHQKRQWYCCLRSLLKNELNTFIITAVD